MKKDEIIIIALDLFLEKGYEKTTITDIMEKAHLSKGGMYHHFASKEDILEAVIIKAMEEEEQDFIKQTDEVATLAEKLALFFYPVTTHSRYLTSFLLFTRKHKKSLLYYKCREIRIQYGAKQLKRLLLESSIVTNQNEKYIDEIARMFFIYGDDISFRGMEVSNKKEFLTSAFEAFVYILDELIHPPEDFIQNFSNQLKILVEKCG